MRLWQRPGESYGHVLLKALGYAMFVAEHPHLEIELRVGLRYKPDLVAPRPAASAGAARFAFWGECGMVTMRKVAWLLKHGQTERLVLFKIDCPVAALTKELREAVEPRQRAGGRLLVVNFVPDIAERAGPEIPEVPAGWYTETFV